MGWFDFKQKKPDQVKALLTHQELVKRGFSQKEAKDMLETVKNSNVIKPIVNETITQLPSKPWGSKINEAIVGLNPFKQYEFDLPQQSLKNYVQGAFNVSNSLVALWSQAVTQRRDYIIVSAELRKFYIVNQLLDLITEDVLNKDEKGNIVAFYSDNEDVQFALDELCDKVDFNILLENFVRDFIDLGEYSLHITAEDGKGIVSIDDDLDQMNMIALYDAGWPSKYLHYAPVEDEAKEGVKQTLSNYKGPTSKQMDYMIEPADYAAHFIMGNSKLRVALIDQIEKGYTITSKADLEQSLQEKLPDYIRVGTPVFWGIISKLRELQLLEMLIPATKINNITQSQIVAVGVSAADPPDKVFAILRRYEDLLNIPIGIDTTNEQLSMAEILTAAGKIRCVPKFDDGKGSLDSLDVRKNQEVDDILNAIHDLRKVICTSIGIPPSLLYGSDDKEKTQELRLFSRYTRKLAMIQESISRGLKQIAAIHLRKLGHKVTPKDIDVQFVQNLTDLSTLEYLEAIDAKAELVGRRLDFIAKLRADLGLAPYLNEENIREWLKDGFNDLTEGLPLLNDEPDPTKQQFVGGSPFMSQPGQDPNNPDSTKQIAPGNPLKNPTQKNNDPYDINDDPDKKPHDFGLEKEV